MLSCELLAGTVAAMAGPARTKGWVTLQTVTMQGGTTSIFLGTEDLNYLKTISLAAKNQPFSQHYFQSDAFLGKKKKSHENKELLCYCSNLEH